MKKPINDKQLSFEFSSCDERLIPSQSNTATIINISDFKKKKSANQTKDNNENIWRKIAARAQHLYP